MTLPQAVQQAEAQADNLIKQQSNTEQSTTNNVAPETKPIETPVPQASNNDSGNWESKYRVLQGKYNKEIAELKAQQPSVPDLQPQVSQLTAQVQQLLTENEQLKNVQQQQAKPVESDSYLAEEYGEEFAQAVARQAQTLAAQEVATVKQELQQVNTQVTQSVEANKNQQLVSLLAKDGINFEQTDTDPLFMEWLNQVDGFSGQPRLSLLQQAFGQGDISRTASFYKAYAQQPAQQTNPYANHVEAASPNHSPDQVQNERPQWTPAQIDAFYDKVRRGQVSEQEVDRVEREIFSTY